MKKTISSFTFCIATVLFATPAHAAVVVVDFETPDFSTSTIVGSNYTAEGFGFSVDLGELGITDSDFPGYNGDQALFIIDSGATLTILSTGNIFDATSLELDGAIGSSPSILATGFYGNGDSITQTFNLDSQAGIEEVFFDDLTIVGSNQGFNALTSLTLESQNGVAFQINDLVVDVTAVPEPSSALLVGLGALGVSLLRRRR